VAAFAQSCQRQQSKNSEHHARCLQSRGSLGMARRNPITHVRQSAKRKNIPTVLTLLQVEELLLYLEEPTHTAVLVDVMTGLRVGELLALKCRTSISRSLKSVSRARSRFNTLANANGSVTQTRTAGFSPCGSVVALANLCAYPRLRTGLCQPSYKRSATYWPGTLNRWHLQPAVKAAGIEGRIGWHTFRRTYATLLKANGEDVKTVQELLRHANSLVTMNLTRRPSRM